MILKRGDIIYVSSCDGFGHEQQNARPAVVVSNDKGNKYAPIIEVVWLTASNHRNLPTHVRIRSAFKPSIALCEQVTTIDKRRIDRICGRCTPREIQNINQAIIVSLGLEVPA